MPILTILVLFIGTVTTYSYGKIYLNYRNEVKKITESDSLEVAERMKNKKIIQISALAPVLIVLPLFIIKISSNSSDNTYFILAVLLVIFFSSSSFLQSLTSKIYIKNNSELIFPGRKSSFTKEDIEKFKVINKSLISVKTKDSKEHMLYSNNIEGIDLIKSFLGIE